MSTVLILSGFLGLLLFLALLIIAAVRKTRKMPWALCLFGSFAMMMVGGGIAAAQKTPVAQIIPPILTRPAEPLLSFEEWKSQSYIVSYQTLFRNIEDYKGAIVYFRGQVNQAMDNGGGFYILKVAVTPGAYGYWDDDVLLSYQGSRILEKDHIEFIARVVGPYTYSTVLGAARTVPSMVVIGLRRFSA